VDQASPLATGAGAALALKVLAAGFFAGDLVVAAGFLTNEILRIIMSRKPVCTLPWKLCKPVGVEISHHEHISRCKAKLDPAFPR
jgi:hypothetical protein